MRRQSSIHLDLRHRCSRFVVDVLQHHKPLDLAVALGVGDACPEVIQCLVAFISSKPRPPKRLDFGNCCLPRYHGQSFTTLQSENLEMLATERRFVFRERTRLCAISRRMAPRVGFEPTTSRLTAGCSTTELPRNIGAPLGGTSLGASLYQVSRAKQPVRQGSRPHH